MKCERLAEQNLSMMLDFVDDENTKYDEAVLKAFLNEKNAYGYIVAEISRKAHLTEPSKKAHHIR